MSLINWNNKKREWINFPNSVINAITSFEVSSSTVRMFFTIVNEIKKDYVYNDRATLKVSEIIHLSQDNLSKATVAKANREMKELGLLEVTHAANEGTSYKIPWKQLMSHFLQIDTFVLSEILPKLSNKEFLTYFIIYKETKGFHRESCTLSISKIIERSGESLSKSTVVKARKRLIELGLIETTRCVNFTKYKLLWKLPCIYPSKEDFLKAKEAVGNLEKTPPQFKNNTPQFKKNTHIKEISQNNNLKESKNETFNFEITKKGRSKNYDKNATIGTKMILENSRYSHLDESEAMKYFEKCYSDVLANGRAFTNEKCQMPVDLYLIQRNSMGRVVDHILERVQHRIDISSKPKIAKAESEVEESYSSNEVVSELALSLTGLLQDNDLDSDFVEQETSFKANPRKVNAKNLSTGEIVSATAISEYFKNFASDSQDGGFASVAV